MAEIERLVAWSFHFARAVVDMNSSHLAASSSVSRVEQIQILLMYTRDGNIHAFNTMYEQKRPSYCRLVVTFSCRQVGYLSLTHFRGKVSK